MGATVGRISSVLHGFVLTLESPSVSQHVRQALCASVITTSSFAIEIFSHFETSFLAQALGNSH